MALRNRAPVWFWIAAAVFTLWGVMGVWAFYADITTSAAAKAQMSTYDRQMFASRPAWFVWAYGISVWSGLFGSVALLLRSRHALWLSVVALVTVVAMFGFILIATDLIAVKGLGPAAGFPVFVVAMSIAQIWVARRAAMRGWIA
jgi:hypothetical protein